MLMYSNTDLAHSQIISITNINSPRNQNLNATLLISTVHGAHTSPQMNLEV